LPQEGGDAESASEVYFGQITLEMLTTKHLLSWLTVFFL